MDNVIFLICVIIMSFIASVASFSLGLYIFIHRRQKLYYRLCIGLYGAFLVVNLYEFIITILALKGDKIIHGTVHLVFLTNWNVVSVLYITLIFTIYLMKSRGITEEELGQTTKYSFVHFVIYGIGILLMSLHFLSSSIVDNIIFFFELVVHIVCTLYCSFIVFYIINVHLKAFGIQGEVNTPLMQSSKKKEIHNFHVRLAVLLVLLFITGFSTIIIALFWLHSKAFNTLGEISFFSCPIGAFILSIMLISGPELQRYRKNQQNREKRLSATIPF